MIIQQSRHIEWIDPYTKELTMFAKNLYIAKDGHRKCKECIKLRTQNFRKTGKYTLQD